VVAHLFLFVSSTERILLTGEQDVFEAYIVPFFSFLLLYLQRFGCVFILRALCPTLSRSLPLRLSTMYQLLEAAGVMSSVVVRLHVLSNGCPISRHLSHLVCCISKIRRTISLVLRGRTRFFIWMRRERLPWRRKCNGVAGLFCWIET